MPPTTQPTPQPRLSRRSFSVLAIMAAVLFGLLLTGSVAFAGLPAQGAPSNLPSVTATPDPCALVGAVVDTPPLSSSLSLFNTLVAGSPSDVWVAGRYRDVVANANRTLTEHWDGAAWSVVPSPNVGSGDNELTGLAAISHNDVWAAGMYHTGNSSNVLAEHWDGTAWTMSALDPSISSGESLGVSALSSSDVWLVGYSNDSSTWQTLIERWDGSTWSVIPSPNVGTGNNILLSVSALSANDIWAVGFHQESNGYQTLVEHWNGTVWSVVPSVDVGTSDNILLGVSAISPDDVWAVGTYSVNSVHRTLTEHWDGTAWSVVSSPHPSSVGNYLNGVTAISADDVWAVGSMVVGSVERTLVLHWDGVAWSVVSSPNDGPDDNQLNAVAAVSASDIWMAGGYYAPSDSLVLMEHFTSPCNTPTLTPTDTPVATATPDPCAIVGVVVPSPNADQHSNNFTSVSALSANDIWAVGNHGPFSTQQTLIEHWDGTTWSVVTSPNVGSGTNELNGVMAISADDVWAVGDNAVAGTIETLIEHWDGTGWVVSPVAPPVNRGFLWAISASGANDIWAVGGYSDTRSQTLIEHWDGTTWSLMPSPNVGVGDNVLHGVFASSANDAWAVGFERSGAGSGVWQTLVLHWDGTAWSIIQSPNVGADQNYLMGVSAISATDVWVVGWNGGNTSVSTLIEHWDGTSWSVVYSPDPSPIRDELVAVTAISADDVWAVGNMVTNNVARSLVEHWDGTAWSVVGSPNASESLNELNSVAAASAGDVWAVGDYYTSLDSSTLVEHFTSPCITPTLTPTDTATPTLTPMGTGTAATFTATPVATSVSTNTPTIMPTGTAVGTGTQGATSTPTMSLSPTASPTECVLTFEDVHPADWDYPYVQWMFCRGVINGYNTSPPCSAEGATCFKPQNYTTRGQVAKIVVLAFALPIDTTGGPHFSDVPQGSTFYDYIETAYNNGLINGYSDNTFRPGNNVTRAQVAKIAVLAAIHADPVHWTLLNPPDNTFEDVAQGSTFYRYVETAAAHGVLAGYPCGIAPAGPCGPRNKPYFLPENNATRAQISKIVYIAATSQLRR